MFTLLENVTPTPDATPRGGFLDLIPTLLLIVAVVVMFFFMNRSRKKQEKETNDMRNNLVVGDEITTIGGIIGRVVSIKEETLVLETSRDGTKIRILKSAIKSVDVHAEDAQNNG